MNYYIEQNGKIVLFDTDKEKIQNTLMFIPDLQGSEIKETQRPIVLSDDCSEFIWADTAEYEQSQAEKEAERIAMLNLTAADVERAIYKAKGIDFEDIISILETTSPTSENPINIKALKIEFKANNFYRGNPYIDAVGEILGFTTEQLNKFFETNDYKYLTNVTLVINPTPADAIVIINDTAQSTITLPYGTLANYTVSKEGYTLITDEVLLTEYKFINVELTPEITEDSSNTTL